jgi:hypothetical protein
MGCDIHFFVERFNDETETWELIKNEKNEYGEFYGSRNYNLFAILANVRNGYGFAGTPTGKGFVPIDDPRGIPPDASQEYLNEVDRWNGDGHSHSYFTVQELMQYDWTQTTTLSGWVHASEYATFKRNGEPNAWAGMISGGGIKHISNEEMEAKFFNPEMNRYDYWQKKDDGSITEIEWSVTYYHCAGNFLSETLPELWQLGPANKVRIVFFFDN